MGNFFSFALFVRHTLRSKQTNWVFVLNESHTQLKIGDFHSYIQAIQFVSVYTASSVWMLFAMFRCESSNFEWFSNTGIHLYKFVISYCCRLLFVCIFSNTMCHSYVYMVTEWTMTFHRIFSIPLKIQYKWLRILLGIKVFFLSFCIDPWNSKDLNYKRWNSILNERKLWLRWFLNGSLADWWFEMFWITAQAFV